MPGFTLGGRLPPGRLRRGATLVEYALVSTLYFFMVFGIIEFCWIASNRNSLTNACSRACRKAAIGETVANVKQEVRDYSLISISDSYIFIERNTEYDGSGSWVDVEDDPDSGTPATANDVPNGYPVRVHVRNYPYKLLTGKLFSWLATYNSNTGTIPISTGIMLRCEN